MIPLVRQDCQLEVVLSKFGALTCCAVWSICHGTEKGWGSLETLGFFGTISNRDNRLVVHNDLCNDGIEILKLY